MLKMAKGIAPTSWLLWISNIFKFESLAISSGMFPCRWLPPKPKVSSIDMLPMERGMVLVKLLFPRNKFWSLFKFPKLGGICPLKRLYCRLLDCKLVNWSTSTGTGQWKLFLLRSRETRKERFPRSGGMVPLRPKLERSKAMTLCCWALQETPIHSQKEVLVDQLPANTWCGSSVIWAFKASSEDWSVK